ncbi:MAG: fibronectin type III domain-containing protein [Nitrosotalea sp.]
MISHNAFAMGPPSCTNQYNAYITNATIIAGNQSYYPLKNNVSFQMLNNQTFSLTVNVKVANQSSQGNTQPGQIWTYDNTLGYDQSQCSGAGPNQNLTFSENVGFPGTYNPATNVNYKYYWFTTNGITFNVYWKNPYLPPSAPQNLRATAGNAQVALSWIAPSNNGGSSIIGYMIEKSTNGGTTWTTIVANTGSAGTTYSDTGLVHSTTYTYRVSAINSVGTSSPSNTATATTFNVVPTPPTGLTATANLLQINLSWNAPSDNGGTPITGYMIERSTDNGNTWSTLVANTGKTGTTYSDTNVLPLTTYTYRVSAINSVGTSEPSNTASATPVGATTPPSLP